MTKGSVVLVYVSKGQESTNTKKVVPNLIGMEQTAGTLKAIEAGLGIGRTQKEFNNNYAEGVIFSQSYSQGIEVEEGTKIDICVSLGPRYTYKCALNIEAPSAAEAPDYRSGTSVGLKLVTDTGVVLLDTTTTSFPYSVSYDHVDSPGANLTVTYTVTTAGETTIDPNTGETVVGEGKTETKSFTRRIDFVRE